MFSAVKVFFCRLGLVIAAIVSMLQTASCFKPIRQVAQSFRRITFQALSAQVISLLLIICILTTSTPAMAPTLLWVSAGEVGQDVRYSFLSSAGFSNPGMVLSETGSALTTNLAAASVFDLVGTFAPVFGLITGKNIFRKKQEAPQRIVILPTTETNTLTVLQGETINLTAVALDKNDQPISGAAFVWTQLDATRRSAPRPLQNGTFEARNSGSYTITAETGGQRAQITVIVAPNGGLGLQRLLRKPEEQRSAVERGVLDDLGRKGLLATREISTKGAHDRAAEEQLHRQTVQKLEEIRLKREERLRQPPTATPTIPNAPNQVQPGGPSAEFIEELPLPETPANAVIESTDELAKITDEKEKGEEREKRAEKAEAPPDVADKSAAESVSRRTAVEARQPGWLLNSRAATRAAAALRPPDEDFWNGGNYWDAVAPTNQVGATPGAAPASGAANGNFTLAAPVVNLPGRGIDVNLSLYYNSRLWSRAGNVISYDPDKGNPAPGWNLGFGKMVNLVGGGCLLVDADGARHSHGGSSSVYNSGGYYSNSYTGHTTDGSFTNYSCNYYSNPYGSGFSASASLPNGTRIDYNSPTANRDQAYPTQITDAQGNYITITYVNNQGPNIQTITDTLGRVVTFNYDGAGRLVSVTGPAAYGGTRVLVRLHYSQLNLSYAFDGGLSVDTPTNTPSVLDAIYYPVTNTGYWFGDAGADPSYSSYGMLTKVMGMRSMSWSGANNNDQGAISMGQLSHQEKYNFPASPVSGLTDAPLYTTQTETWHAMEGTPAAVTTYGVSTSSTEETITVTAPNGTKSVQTSYLNPGAWNDGVYYKNETRDAANNVLGKTQTYMQQGDWGSFRPTRIESTDERNQTTAAEFVYGNGVYNQVTVSKQLNYANQLYRETRYYHENSGAYINRHIFSLVKSEEVFDAGGTRLSRVDYEYDNNAVASGTGNPNLVNTPNVIMHNYRSDPFTTQTQNGANCTSGQFNYQQCAYEGQMVEVWLPGGGYDYVYCSYECYQYEQVSAYDPNTIYRGNVTKTTTYADAASLTGAIVYDSTYDITGNARTTTTNCCQQMAFDYSSIFQYAYPTQMTKGSSDPNSPHRMSQGGWYDYNTGEPTQATDFNGRSTYYYYDQAQRPTYIAYPTGGKRTFGYDDNAMYLYDYTKEADDTVASGTLTYLNGRGQSRGQTTILPASGSSSSEWRFDSMGRKTQVSMPYYGSTPTQWTTYAYDALSRPVQVTAPDGSVSQTFYNETARPSSASNLPGQTVRSRDAWGRERWARSDDFGRTAEVVEPDPNGNGSVASNGLATTYGYDSLDRLVQTNQGAQIRAFGYDSLGRLIRQKLAEQSGSLTAGGQFVGGNNGGWSDAFVYDARSNLIQRTDARGVKTNYNYTSGGAPDPLNRLLNISYDASGADPTHTIAGTSAVTLGYMTSGDKTRIATVTTAYSAEENIYDIEGRIAEYKIIYGTNPSQPLSTNYLYDTTSRLTEIRYPQAYGMPGAPRKIVTPTYDGASRLTELKVDNQIQLSEIQYNPLSQVTQLKTGAATGNADLEQYFYDGQTGLLTNQKVIKANTSQTLLDQTYEYQRGNSNGTLGGKTGQLTRITNNLDHNKNRLYEFDALGRLKTAKGGLGAGIGNPVANWTQSYTYDRYGNRTGVSATGTTSNSQNVPTDGLPSQSYDQPSNRINTAGYIYDLAGNLIRGQMPDGTWQRYEYDTAGRMTAVKDDAGVEKQGIGYTSGRQRLVRSEPGATGLTWYVWGGASVIAEYTSSGYGAALVWRKSYIYAGLRLLSTFTNNGSGETLEFQHPDRLGTKLVTNNAVNSSFEQSTLPFGTELTAESTGATNQRFTSYDRSTVAQLDYAINRSYSSGQGRFTSVDPSGMIAASVNNPQSMNLYAYVENNPIDFTDPTGLNKSSDEEICSYSGKKNDDGTLIYDGTVRNGKCQSHAGSVVQIRDDAGSGFWGSFRRNLSDSIDRLFGREPLYDDGTILKPRVPDTTTDSPSGSSDPGGGWKEVAIAIAIKLAQRRIEQMIEQWKLGKWVKVGWWSTKSDYNKMKRSGLTIEEDGGQTFFTLAQPNGRGPDGWGSQAPRGYVYSEFEVPERSLLQGGEADWRIAVHPNASYSQQLKVWNNGGVLTPPVRNVSDIIKVKE